MVFLIHSKRYPHFPGHFIMMYAGNGFGITDRLPVKSYIVVHFRIIGLLDNRSCSLLFVRISKPPIMGCIDKQIVFTKKICINVIQDKLNMHAFFMFLFSFFHTQITQKDTE